MLPELVSYSSFPKAALIQIGILLLALMSFVRLFIKGEAWYALTPFVYACLVFLFWATLSFGWIGSNYDGVELITHWGICAAFFFILINRVLNFEWILILFRVIILSTLCFSIIGCLQYLYDFSLFCNPEKFPSTFSNPNYAVHVLAMVIPIMCVGLFFFFDKESKILTGVSLTSATIYLLYTSSQAGIVALGLSLILVLFFLIREKKKTGSEFQVDRFQTSVICISIVLIIFFSNLPSARTDQFSRQPKAIKAIAQIYKNPDQAGSGRLKVWPNCIEIIKDYPFLGVGLNNFLVFYPLYWDAINAVCFKIGTDLTHAHNEFIQIGGELGITGLILFLIAVGLSFLQLFRLTCNQYNLQTRLIGIGLIGGFTGFCVESFFSFPLRMELPILLISLYMAVATILTNQSRTIERKVKINQPVALASALICVVFLSLVAIHQVNRLKSDHLYYKAKSDASIKRWSASLLNSQKAYAINPDHFDNGLLLGRALLETGQIKKAIDVFERYIAIYPYHLNTLLNLGVASMSNQDHTKAMSMFERAKTINSCSPEIDTQIANIYLLQGDYEAAYKYFNAAKENKSTNPLVYYNLGFIEKKNHNYTAAEKNYLKALELGPTIHKFHAELALLYLQKLSSPQKALLHIKKYLEVDSTSRLAEYFRQLLNTVEPSS